jgi:hypothetical protein
MIAKVQEEQPIRVLQVGEVNRPAQVLKRDGINEINEFYSSLV